jgi:hypothetical protein
MKEITIAIQGNFKKYEQVIEELEKLGGINKFGLCGDVEIYYYYIGDNSIICCDTISFVEGYFQRNNDFRKPGKTVGKYYTLSGYKRMKRRAKINSFIKKMFNQ